METCDDEKQLVYIAAARRLRRTVVVGLSGTLPSLVSSVFEGSVSFVFFGLWA